MLGQIQKRRRRSTPNSPVSPTATWQNADIAKEIYNSTPRDELLHYAANGSGSPALEVDVPSPTFDLPSLASSRPTHIRSGSSELPRILDQHENQINRPLTEQPRPATSASHAPHLEIPQTGKRRVFSSSPLDQSFSSPGRPSSHGRESPPPDVDVRYSDRAAYSNRNHNHSFLAANSSPVEETPSARFSGAKRSRLNLLNPMSLLARRRASQNSNSFEDGGLHVKTQSMPAIPDDYDPRIRGNIVHDFSAPKPRRIQSSLESSALQSVSPAGQQGRIEHVRRASDFLGLNETTSKRNSQSPSYSPVFKEHFQEDRKNLSPAQTGYLHSLALSEKSVEVSGTSVPAFAKKLPVVLQESPDIREAAPTRPPPPPPKENQPLDDVPETSPIVPESVDEPKSLSTQSSTPRRKKPASISGIRRASEIPKHMTSTSSRFSFIGNGDSAEQERALEEKHKQHVNNNKVPERDGEAQEDDDYDNYDFDADDGLEEQIPGVNAAASDDEDYMRRPISQALNASTKRGSLKIDPDTANEYARQDNLQTFHFTPEPSLLSSVSTGQTSQPTPRDEDGRIIGLADTLYSPRRSNGHSRQRSDLSIMEISGSIAGLGLLTTQTEAEQYDSSEQHLPIRGQEPFKDEELYFDDGELDDLVNESNSMEVDERIFDEGSDGIRDIPAENARKLEEAQQRSAIAKALPSGLTSSLQQHGSFQQSGPSEAPLEFKYNNFTSEAGTAGLTEGNLAAYHAALVSAADTAAANGRFRRSVTNSQPSADHRSSSHLEDSPPGLSTDEKCNSHNVEFFGIDEDHGFDFDDNDEDDLIAEANAEVLENDDDGFYGQEFGFYARAKGKHTSELEYGGYFAPHGFNGIKRSHSAKANFQEPSLTPITERSEWSARNSVASLQIPGMPSSAQSIPSPGIAQLLDFESSSFDESMSFEALMKLRRGTFGGSSTSVNSTGGPSNSSPLAHASAHTFSDPNHRMTSSINSLTGSAGIPESEEEDDDVWEQTPFTRNTAKKNSETLELRTPESATMFSPLSARSDKGRMGHSRNSSGAESVSYVRDTDGRWLLERRRTGDDGEGEVIEREYLAGSRI